VSATPAPRNEASGTQNFGGFDRDRHFLFRWPFSSESLGGGPHCSLPYLAVFYFRPLSHQPLFFRLKIFSATTTATRWHSNDFRPRIRHFSSAGTTSGRQVATEPARGVVTWLHLFSLAANGKKKC
jgi:hypothetical protein